VPPMRRARNLLRSTSVVKRLRRTDAMRVRHSSAMDESGGLVAAYTSRKSCIVCVSSISGRHDDGTCVGGPHGREAAERGEVRFDDTAKTRAVLCARSL
jgi:hypothetical protein